MTKNITLIIAGLVLVAFAGYGAFLISNDQQAQQTSNDFPTQQEAQGEHQELLENGTTYCYEYRFEDEDFTEFASILLSTDGQKVQGVKSGSTQAGEYSIGYEGGFYGILLSDGTINAINTTAIGDGGGITAEEHYTFIDGELTEYRYAYKEDFENNILRIDETVADNGLGQEFPITTPYQQVDCDSML